MTGKISLWKRGLAALMIMIMAFMLPASPLSQTTSRAAAAGGDIRYIKELRLFISSEENAFEQAKDWCSKQDGDWKVLEDEDKGLDLNSGSGKLSGLINTEVHLCYCTTTNPDEAVRDLAVMNEKGNYSEGAYERILKDQKDKYADMIKNMKTMLNEYRTNYKNNLPTAVAAHDYLNTYIEDDSGKLLGDLLLDITDEKLTEVMLQANGKVVLFIEQQLAAACDTGKTTFLDRMTKLGGYDALRQKFMTAYNGDANKADKALKANYSESANKLYDCWSDVQKQIENVKTQMVKNGVLGMTADQYNDWVTKNSSNDQIFLMKQEFDILTALASYKYGSGTLLDFFIKPRSDFQGDKIKELYPLAASLSKGQLASIDENVSMFYVITDALGAAVRNDYKTGESAKLLDSATAEEKKALEDSKKLVEGSIEKLKDEKKTSVYEGVDREIFKGGVAVTSTAESYSNSSETKWVDKFVDSGDYKKYSIGITAAAVGSLILGGLFRFAENNAIITGMYDMFNDVYSSSKSEFKLLGSASKLDKKTYDYIKTVRDWDEAWREYEYGQQNAVSAFNDLEGRVLEDSISYYVFKYLKIGFTILTVLLSVADITLTAITLYNYYHREHLPIPHHMVDLSYNENKESSYIVYKSVRDNKDKCGDLNGDNGKQWLALYATYDKDAGDPLVAPEEGVKNILVQYGSSTVQESGYLPLHMFGTPNVAQNLTFADGENGYSFNDNKKGTYLFFRRDAAAASIVTYEQPEQTEEATDTASEVSEGNGTTADATVSGSAATVSGTGTAMSGGVVALIAFACLAGGGFAGYVIGATRRKKYLADK